MESNHFLAAFIPLILSQIIARLYIIKNLEKPANFANAPWYVKLSFNSGIVKLFDLKESVLFYLIGFVGFSVYFIASNTNLIILLLALLIFLLGIFMFWRSVQWMDKNERWGSRKQNENRNGLSLSKLIVKDGFLLFNTIVIFFLFLVMGYMSFREIVREKGYQDGVREAKEHLR